MVISRQVAGPRCGWPGCQLPFTNRDHDDYTPFIYTSYRSVYACLSLPERCWGYPCLFSCLSLITLFIWCICCSWAGFLATGFSPLKKKKRKRRKWSAASSADVTECIYWVWCFSVWMVSTFWGVLFLILFSLYLSRCTYTYVYLSRQIESIISGSVPRRLLGLEYSLALLLPPSILIRGILISIKIR